MMTHLDFGQIKKVLVRKSQNLIDIYVSKLLLLILYRRKWTAKMCSRFAHWTLRQKVHILQNTGVYFENTGVFSKIQGCILKYTSVFLKNVQNTECILKIQGCIFKIKDGTQNTGVYFDFLSKFVKKIIEKKFTIVSSISWKYREKLGLYFCKYKFVFWKNILEFSSKYKQRFFFTLTLIHSDLLLLFHLFWSNSNCHFFHKHPQEITAHHYLIYRFRGKPYLE